MDRRPPIVAGYRTPSAASISFWSVTASAVDGRPSAVIHVCFLPEYRLKLHHCAEHRLSGVTLKTISVEFVDLVPVGENAVSGIIESVNIGNAVTFAVDKNLAMIFVE